MFDWTAGHGVFVTREVGLPYRGFTLLPTGKTTGGGVRSCPPTWTLALFSAMSVPLHHKCSPLARLNQATGHAAPMGGLRAGALAAAEAELLQRSRGCSHAWHITLLRPTRYIASERLFAAARLLVLIFLWRHRRVRQRSIMYDDEWSDSEVRCATS